MSWKHNGYTWKSGWFIDENFNGGNADDYLMFSADGVTTKGYGVPGITFASNIGETRSDNGGSWDSQARRNKVGDNITFDFNKDSIVITGLPDHPILGVEALTQTLDSEVEGVEWQHTLYDDIVTINANSPYTSGKTIMVSTRAGNDIFYVNGDIAALTGCDRDSGVNLFGGPGKDCLTLAGSLDDWDIQISSS